MSRLAVRRCERKLQQIPAPHVQWKETVSAEEELAARNALCEFAHVLQAARPVPLRREPQFGMRFSYLNYLALVQIELHRQHYRYACNELQKLMFFEPVLQEKVRLGVLFLLKDSLGDLTCEDFGKPCRTG